jgi:hypothetical protein
MAPRVPLSVIPSVMRRAVAQVGSAGAVMLSARDRGRSITAEIRGHPMGAAVAARLAPMASPHRPYVTRKVTLLVAPRLGSVGAQMITAAVKAAQTFALVGDSMGVRAGVSTETQRHMCKSTLL